MRERGVRVDLDKASQIKKMLKKKEEKLLKEIHRETGINVEIWAADSVSQAFDAIDPSINLGTPQQGLPKP